MRDLIEDIVEWYENLSKAFCGVVLVITSPLWVLPYMIWKKKGGAE
jgi:hypothetical protein